MTLSLGPFNYSQNLAVNSMNYYDYLYLEEDLEVPKFGVNIPKGYWTLVLIYNQDPYFVWGNVVGEDDALRYNLRDHPVEFSALAHQSLLELKTHPDRKDQILKRIGRLPYTKEDLFSMTGETEMNEERTLDFDPHREAARYVRDLIDPALHLAPKDWRPRMRVEVDEENPYQVEVLLALTGSSGGANEVLWVFEFDPKTGNLLRDDLFYLDRITSEPLLIRGSLDLHIYEFCLPAKIHRCLQVIYDYRR